MTYDEKIKKDADDARLERQQDDRQKRDEMRRGLEAVVALSLEAMKRPPPDDCPDCFPPPQDDRQERDDEAAAFQRERMRDEIDEGRAEQRQAERDLWAYC